MYKNYYKKIKKFFCCFLSLLLVACTSAGTSSGENKSSRIKFGEGDEIVFNNYDEKLGDNIPIIRGEVAKIIALTFSDNFILDSEDQTEFKDVNKGDIYYEYIYTCSNLGYMKGDGVNFRPYDNITLKEVSSILELINSNVDNKLLIDEDNIDKPVSYGLWVELFIEVINDLSNKDILGKYKLKQSNTIIVATKKDNNELNNYIITDKGKLKASNLDLSNYRDCEIEVFKKNNEIVFIKSFVTDTPTIENAYIYEYDTESISIFIGGIYRKFKIIKGKDDDLKDNICSIKISGDTAQAVSVFKDSSENKVRVIDNNTIKLSDNKSYTFDDNLKVYGDYKRTLTFEELNNIRVGTTAKFFISGDKILAVVFEKEIYPERIRVILNDTTYSTFLHKNVTISATDGFMINGEEYTEKTLTITEENYQDYIKGDFLEVKPLNEGKIIVNSITRANNYNPGYRGIIEIVKVSEGFNIISDVTFDEYLYQVVPSEMPTKYGLEASKIQAICARTYAYKQFYRAKYENFGANVDDSTSCQVYNNISDTETSIMAVNLTTNQIITYNNNPIDAYFFSTTGGTTASVGDVWTSNIQYFPNTSVEYLMAKAQHYETEVDLTIEDNAYEFFKNRELNAIEKDVDWFRWDFKLERDELSTTINNNLQSRYSARPDLLLVKQADETFVSTPISSVGLVKDINIVKRGSGGNVIILDIIGTENTVRVYTELNIRSLIKPYQYISGKEKIVINTNNSSVSNYTLMPSTFFTIEKTFNEQNEIETITFYGGGNGHGVGLSQNGAYALLESGMDYIDVIKHYYSGCEISNITGL